MLLLQRGFFPKILDNRKKLDNKINLVCHQASKNSLSGSLSWKKLKGEFIFKL